MHRLAGGEPASAFLGEEEDLRLLRFGVRAVAEQLGISERTLRRQFERQGIRVRDYLKVRRRTLALSLLGGDLPVQTLARRLGFSSAQTFARYARREFGETPTSLRRRIRAERIEAYLA